MSLSFVIGGASSGKSDYAVELARQMSENGNVLFIATATASDGELASRIERHKRERPDHWQTVEAPRRVGERWEHSWKRVALCHK